MPSISWPRAFRVDGHQRHVTLVWHRPTGREDMMRRLAIAALAALASVAATAANAQEVTLKGITAFAEKTFNSRAFERFIEKVNADGKGQVQINYIGGPKAMPPFEVGNALKSGVVDIAN